MWILGLFCSIVKNAMEIFDCDFIKFVIDFGGAVIFTTLILQILKHRESCYLLVSSSVFSNDLKVSLMESFMFSIKLITKFLIAMESGVFLLCVKMVNRKLILFCKSHFTKTIDYF